MTYEAGKKEEQMIDKVYLVLGHDDGGSEGRGDYISLYGVYVDEYEAKERMVELTKESMDASDTRETFEVKSVEFNQNIEEFLGGYAE